MSDLIPRPRDLDGKIKDGQQPERAPTQVGELIHDAFTMGADLVAARARIESLSASNEALMAERTSLIETKRTQIETLTAERDAALAKLAEIERAETVWVTEVAMNVVQKKGFTATAIYRNKPLYVTSRPIPLIRKPGAQE